MKRLGFLLMLGVVCWTLASCGDDDSDDNNYTSESKYDNTIKVSIDRLVKLSNSAACNFKVEGDVEGFYVQAYTDEAYKSYDYKGVADNTVEEGVYFSKDELDYVYTISSLDPETSYWLYVVPVNAKGKMADVSGRGCKIFTTTKNYDQPEVEMEGESVEQNRTVWNFNVKKNSYAKTFYYVYSAEEIDNSHAYIAFVIDGKIANNDITAHSQDGMYSVTTSTPASEMNIVAWAKRYSTMSGVINTLRMSSRYYAPAANESIEKSSVPVANKRPAAINGLMVSVVSE